jgi:hypothetical protein
VTKWYIYRKRGVRGVLALLGDDSPEHLVFFTSIPKITNKSKDIETFLICDSIALSIIYNL